MISPTDVDISTLLRARNRSSPSGTGTKLRIKQASNQVCSLRADRVEALLERRMIPACHSHPLANLQ